MSLAPKLAFGLTCNATSGQLQKLRRKADQGPTILEYIDHFWKRANKTQNRQATRAGIAILAPHNKDRREMMVVVTRINNFEANPGAGNIAKEDFTRVMALMASPPSVAYYRGKEN